MPPIRAIDRERILFSPYAKTNRAGQAANNKPQYNIGQLLVNFEWNEEEVQRLIHNSAQIQRWLKDPFQHQREVCLSDGFSPSKSLNFNRLQAVIIQSRGEEKDIKCARCQDPKRKVFDCCVVLRGFANDACAADVWANSGADCAYNDRTGMDNNWGIPRKAKVRREHQRIKMAIAAREQQQQAPASLPISLAAPIRMTVPPLAAPWIPTAHPAPASAQSRVIVDLTLDDD